MDDDSKQELGQVSPEEALRQLVELRLQVGSGRFNALATQMGMQPELQDYVEQMASQVEAQQAPTAPASPGLLDLSGQPVRSSGPSGLVDASGRPIGGGGGGLVDAMGRPIGGGGFN